MHFHATRFNLKAPRLRWISCFVATTLAVFVAGISGKDTAVMATVSPSIANPAPAHPLPVPAGQPLSPPSTPAPAGGLCPDELITTLNGIVNQPRFHGARWGILIEPLTSTTHLYSQNPTQFFIPASNTKLLTTAAALQIVPVADPQTFATFAEQIRTVNQDSNNQSADALLRQIGGQHAVRVALSRLGVDAADYRQVDGSGLSRNNLVKPSALVTLLKAMYVNDESGLFYNSLPIAGMSGTLRNRFQNTTVQRRVHAKTGTLQGVRALSGYLENTDYGTIIFSIVVNQPGQSGEVLRQAIDQIVLQTARVVHCDRTP